jgi:hypothetical protein
MLGCTYEEPKKKVEKEVEKVFAVDIQVVGSLIEGMTVCFDEKNLCKHTDKYGMVQFDDMGTYSFKIRDMHISKVEIDTNRTIISPYQFFEDNETLAKRTILLLHAFDKTEDLSDEQVLLTLSSYIPKDKSIKSLLAKTKWKSTYKDVNNTKVGSTEENITKVLVSKHEVLQYMTNDLNITNNKEHNITINFSENNITRDDDDMVHINIPSKLSYANLNDVMKFVDLSYDKNVTINNSEEKYLLTKNSLTSFNIGEKYLVTAIVREDHVVLSFLDNTSRITDESILIVNAIDNILSTHLLDLELEESEEVNEVN